MIDNEIKCGLYIVPTPIGNIGDMSPRAKNILQRSDIIACEDTRNTGKLLKLLELPKKRLISYHEHNETSRTSEIIGELLSGAVISLISDAGTPLISDPGYRLISEVAKTDIKIYSIPGPTAFVPALTASGLPSDKFIFLGFPPQKKGRKTFIGMAVNQPFTSIFYESPNRIVKFIEQLIEFGCSDRNISISREISKIYEEHFHGKVKDALVDFGSRDKIKGEFVIVLAKNPAK